MENYLGCTIETSYLTPIAHFALAIESGKMTIEMHENYLKGSYRNRVHIATANGVLSLSIPLKKGKNQKMPIKEVEISTEENWQKRHWIALQSAYGNAPFWEHYGSFFEPIFEKKYQYLIDWNTDLQQLFVKLLKLGISIDFTKEWERKTTSTQFDARNKITPKHEYDEWSKINYPQVFLEKHGFLSNLSMFDLMMCQGPRSKDFLLKIAPLIRSTLTQRHQDQ